MLTPYVQRQLLGGLKVFSCHCVEEELFHMPLEYLRSVM